MANKRRVFDSVFQSLGAISQPTPDIEFIVPGQPFGGPIPFAHDRTQAPDSLTRSLNVSISSSADVRDQVAWDRSWHTATEFLARPLTTNPVLLDDDAEPLPMPSNAFLSALKDVLEPETRLPHAAQTEDFMLWYSQQVRYHFGYYVLNLISKTSDKSKPELILPNCIKILQRAHRLYLYGLAFIVRQLDESKPGTSGPWKQKFRYELHAIVSNSIFPRISESLRKILASSVSTILGISPRETAELSMDGNRLTQSGAWMEGRSELLTLVESLHNIGLGGIDLEIMFAEVMNDAMSYYVHRTYGRIWSRTSAQGHDQQGSDGSIATGRKANSEVLTFESIDSNPRIPRTANHATPSQCVNNLCEWVKNEFSTLNIDVLRKLDRPSVDWTHVEKWMKIGIGRLAGLRTQELFDIVENWPNSNGALDDLRTAVDTPQRRLQLTDVFSANLKDRLLHPGTSTLMILRTYISMIWSFHSLDRSKVLLDRVAYPLQVYLCSREDTVRIIITGLLSDTEDASGVPIDSGGDKLTELAILLNKGTEDVGPKTDEDLDWNDMDWVPDPVDAGPGYRRSKNADVIGTLIGVLGSQEVFIKEFQNIIGENLLRSEGDFKKEMKVLELLKTRFGEAPLQSCEVMIKDIQDSRKVDGVIRKNQNLDPSAQEIAEAEENANMLKQDYTNPEGFFKPSLHAKILSRLFWPQLHSESYRVPDGILKLQKRYELGFESLKNSRKLTWLHALGQATVELEFEDRFVFEEVHTWQAAVIWAFQSDEEDDDPTIRSVEELVDQLKMDETLVRSALKFWASKLVLREIRRDEYIVLETLNQEDRAKSDVQAVAAIATAENSADDNTLMSNDELTLEKMQMYWQFIQGMLTNSSPQMPLQQIAMMLKMLIADGFPYSNEELQEFLSIKVAAGELDFIAGKYKLKK